MTEKTVAYYEELVRQEIADKTINSECMVENIKGDVFSLGLGSLKQNDVGQYIVERNELPFSSSRRELCSQCEDIINQNQKKGIEIIKKILGHEIRPHHILQWFEKNNITLGFSVKQMVVSKDGDIIIIPRDTSKPFSEQADDTKIALGKVVEEVLQSKDK